MLPELVIISMILAGDLIDTEGIDFLIIDDKQSLEVRAYLLKHSQDVIRMFTSYKETSRRVERLRAERKYLKQRLDRMKP